MSMSTNESGNVNWPSKCSCYQWKGTISCHSNSFIVVAFCNTYKRDVIIKIKPVEDDDIDEYRKNIKQLLNIRHSNLLTPIHSFLAKSEIWTIYPRCSGGSIIEILSTWYPKGIRNEKIVAAILYDIALGLYYLHKQQICHCNISVSAIYIDIENGICLLTELNKLKAINFKRKKVKINTISTQREAFTDPLILLNDNNASWFANDIYSFGITALQLIYGALPPLNYFERAICSNDHVIALVINNWLRENIFDEYPTDIFNLIVIMLRLPAITIDSYHMKCPLSKSFEKLIEDCCALKLKDRIKINQLIQHKFFKQRCDHLLIKQTFGFLVKSKEERIIVFSAPKSMSMSNY